MINFILVIQNNNLGTLTFSEMRMNETLYVFIHARNCLQALQVIQIFKPDCFLIEENLATTSGLKFAHSLHAQPHMERVPTILFDPCHTLSGQKLTMPSQDKFHPTIPHIEILLEIIDKMLLFPGRLMVNFFATKEIA